MRKKVALTAAAVAMVGTLAVGGTLAWFTDTETATNVVTVGNVDVKIDETGEGEVNEDGDGLNYDVMPGKTYEKNVDITNVGSNPAYMKAIITVSSNNENIPAAIKDGRISLGNLYEGGTWSDVAGGVQYVVYYNDEDNDFIAEKDDVWNLFDNFTFPKELGNEFENSTFNINVEVQAIQADNNPIPADDTVATIFDSITATSDGKVTDIVGTPSVAKNQD
ncbi:MAG TPA: M73 family metallopeptidase [Candidatus Enterocloster faecavium]|uniref:M73 family metallopeptidase n=1 Tax=Candidatus Enterocloster faecavium TaxID=2838560 RepID=A0A9D2LA17_9FIRM|nr:M73 family metallopeptidase [Candidatus Enterocloster faecavium]